MTVLLHLWLFTSTYMMVAAQILPIPPKPDSRTCEPITNIAVCANIPGYSNASFPNFRDHTTQQEASTELNHFIPLIQSECSNAIVHLLCAVYAPFCAETRTSGIIRLPPCRHLCQYVRNGCESTLRNHSNLDWPQHLNCDLYPAVADDPACFAPPEQDLPFVTIPPFEVPTPTTAGCC